MIKMINYVIFTKKKGEGGEGGRKEVKKDGRKNRRKEGRKEGREGGREASHVVPSRSIVLFFISWALF